MGDRQGGFPKWLGRAHAGRAGRRGCGGDAGKPFATGFGGEVSCAFDGEAEPPARRVSSTGGVVELAPRVAHIVRMLVGDNLLPHGCQSVHRLSRYHGYGSVEAKSLFEKIQKRVAVWTKALRAGKLARCAVADRRAGAPRAPRRP